MGQNNPRQTHFGYLCLTQGKTKSQTNQHLGSCGTGSTAQEKLELLAQGEGEGSAPSNSIWAVFFFFFLDGADPKEHRRWQVERFGHVEKGGPVSVCVCVCHVVFVVVFFKEKKQGGGCVSCVWF